MHLSALVSWDLWSSFVIYMTQQFPPTVQALIIWLRKHVYVSRMLILYTSIGSDQ